MDVGCGLCHEDAVAVCVEGGPSGIIPPVTVPIDVVIETGESGPITPVGMCACMWRARTPSTGGWSMTPASTILAAPALDRTAPVLRAPRWSPDGSTEVMTRAEMIERFPDYYGMFAETTYTYNVVVEPDEVLRFLHPLPAKALWGVGPATLGRLERFGVRTVGDIAALPEATLVGALGSANGRHLSALAHGIDDRAVVPDQPPKSIGHEETFAADHHEHAPLAREVVRMSDSVASRLRTNGLAGRTVTLKVRFGDFRTITRSTTVPSPLDEGPAIARAARALLDAVDPSPGIRLLGVSVSGLTSGEARQLSLDDVAGAGWHEASGAVDAIRERFGSSAIGPGSIVGPRGLRVKTTGQNPWGPGDVG